MKNKKNDVFAEPDNLEKFILEWNCDFPIDRWWRLKHNVSFNSSAHREMSFIDMAFEFFEEQMYQKYLNQVAEERENPYVSGSGEIVYERVHSRELTDEEWENISLDNF